MYLSGRKILSNIMNLNDDLTILDQDGAAQSAYDESKRLRFDGQALHPWTIARHSVAMTLGCKLITAVGPFVSEFLDCGNYSNIYRDVVIVLWLCSLDAEQVIEVDGAEVPKSIQRAYAWAEENGVEYGGPAYLEGVKLLDRILKQILASFFEVEQSEPVVKKKDIARPGRSRLLVRLQRQAENRHPVSSILCRWRRLFSGRPSESNDMPSSGSREVSINGNGLKKSES